MKESYNLNPTVLSDDEIEDYCRGCFSRGYGLRLMRESFAEKSEALARELKIHETNYRKVHSLIIEDEGCEIR